MDRTTFIAHPESQADRAEIARFVKFLFEHFILEPCIVELRALKLPKCKTSSGYFDREHVEAMVSAAVELSGVAGAVYFTINPVNRELLARAENRAKAFAEHTTADADIVCRRMLFLDFDPKRPAGISSTDAELAAAVACAKACREWLLELGWAGAVLAASGNGAHLLYRIDLPNDADAAALVKDVLRAIAAHCDTDAVKVDTSVGNPARICKLYGTLAKKGDSTTDRPHRIAKVLDLPETLGTVPREELDSLVASATSRGPTAERGIERSPVGLAGGRSASAFDVDGWAKRCNVQIGKTKPMSDGGTLYELGECPFRRDQKDGGAWIRQFADGGIAAGCHHQKCEGKGWSEMRDVLEPDWREKGDGQPVEHDTDPHRLAELFRDTQCLHFESGVLTVTHWQGSWWRWNGCRWELFPDGELRKELQRFIKAEFGRMALRAGAGRHKMMPHVKTNVADMLEGLVLIPESILQPAWLTGNGPWPADEVLPAKNGLIHIPSLASGGEFLLPPSPNFFSCIGLDYDFDPNAGSPTEWLRFLAQLWPDEPRSIETLQEFMGYLLTADTKQQKILLLVGPPRSGKGTITRVITALVGPANVCSPNLADFASNFGLSPLIGKSVATINDARLSGRKDTGMIVERLLNISGEDSLTIDRKYMPPVTVKLSVRLVVCSNELPQFNDASGALANRMIVLRMANTFLGKEDLGLFDRLKAELTGILRWAVEGWARLRKRRQFAPPESSRESIRELHEIGSPVQAFVEECCVVADGQSISRHELYGAYGKWSEGHGSENVENESTFGRNLRTACPKITASQKTVHGKKIRVHVGIGLRPGFPSQEIANGSVCH